MLSDLFDDGRKVSLSEPIIIGRSPIALANVPGATLFPIDDPTMSVSSTHLVVGHDASGLWVQDTGSTNGSSIILPSGQTFELLPGVRGALDIGSRVKFGERSFQVVNR